MICVYFEIPYERQLIRIALSEIRKMSNAVAEAAEANGATSFKMSCASVYRFSSTAIAPIFSVNLFLQFLADTLRVYKKRVVDYRVIIDCCEETDTEDGIADHFTAYKNLLIPSRGFFASPQAETLLQAYIRFEYVPKLELYYCANFIVPKTNKTETPEAPCRIYLPEGVSGNHALYHFMLLHPLTDEAIAANLSEEEKKQYDEAKHVLYYFRTHRFCPEYPDYFNDTFSLYTRLYFRVFAKSYYAAELSVIHTEKNAEEAEQLLNILPAAHAEPMPKRALNIDKLSVDFIQLAYLMIYAARFVFKDEIQELFLLLHKSEPFITNLYEWMYASGIIEAQHDMYSVNRYAVSRLERRLGSEKDKVNQHIAAFLWEKYENGMLSPDESLKNVFSMLHFKPEDRFLLHYFFHRYSDKEIPDIDIGSFKSAPFFTALESYQKALKINKRRNDSEAVYAIKNAVSGVQNRLFPAGEYRALFCTAVLHLSQNKIEDAVTYFQYALDCAEALNDSSFICEALFNLGISYFLQTNLHAAADCLGRLQQAATDYFEQPQKIPCMFMQGRIALQLGDYNRAEFLFQEAGKAASGRFQEWKPLCNIWYARVLSQKGQISKAQQIFIAHLDASADALLFLNESYLFTPILRDERSKHQLPVPVFTNAPEPHQSGFALAEELVWGRLYDKPATQIFYNAMDSYYRFRVAAVTAEDTAQTYLQQLENTAREALRYRDIYASIYSYLCYDAFLRSEGNTSDTANGYLSRAFKALQNCMNNITENNIRDTFIFRNVWNAKLYAAAQKNKLI